MLGSATPSVESHANALAGQVPRGWSCRRASGRGACRASRSSTGARSCEAGGDPILTPAAARGRSSARLERGEQALLLLNRRGYATSLLCRECGQQAACPNCSVVAHRCTAPARTAVCHYCGYLTEAPARLRRRARASTCGSPGYGTEQVRGGGARPRCPTARDRAPRPRPGAAPRRGGAASLAAFEAGETDILVGTQMIAKGHDFPRVTLVGVVDADVGLGLPDFRAAERTFQLLTQVAGRAGRAELAGRGDPAEPLPDHYALQPRLRPGLRRLLRARDGVPADDGLSAGGRAPEPRRAVRATRRRARGRPRPWRSACASQAAGPLPRARPGPRAPRPPAAGAPLPDPAEGTAGGDARGGAPALVDRYGELRWPGVAVDVDPVSVM